MKAFVVLLAACALAYAAPAFGDSFRCNNVVFLDGDSRADLLVKCGEPDYEVVIEEKTEGEAASDQTFLLKKKYVVEWYYNCGENQFIKIVAIEGGKIISIRNGQRGTAEDARDCR